MNEVRFAKDRWGIEFELIPPVDVPEAVAVRGLEHVLAWHKAASEGILEVYGAYAQGFSELSATMLGFSFNQRAHYLTEAAAGTVEVQLPA